MKLRSYINVVLSVWIGCLFLIVSLSPVYGKNLYRYWKGCRTKVKCTVVRTDRKRGVLKTISPLSRGSKLASAPLVSLKEAQAYYEKRKSLKRIEPTRQLDQSPQALGASGWFIIPWGQEEEKLARGLGCYDEDQTADPIKIYEFVRNHIDYEPSFGFLKGGEMTLIDGSGNAFDQASLLIDLLMMAGYHADYVYGVIRLTGEEFIRWMGIADNPVLAYRLLADAGIPAEIHYTGDHIDYVDMQHMWVKLWAEDGESSYALDPSFKEYQIVGGINIGSAMGYDRSVFLNRATQGMTTTNDYLQNMNRANIRADLASYSSNLVNYIESNLPGKGMEEVIGGRKIIPVTGQQLVETLPYEIGRIHEYNGYFEGRDLALTTKITITYQGWEHQFPAFDLYGERMTLSFAEGDGKVTANLFLDGYLQNSFTVEEPTEALRISIDHPCAAGEGTYLDDENFFNLKPVAGNIYCFCFGFGKTSKGALEKHRKTMQEFMLDNTTPDSEPDPVQGEALCILGLSWMAETSRASEIGDYLAGTRSIRQHIGGIIKQEASPTMDIALSMTSIVGTNDSNVKACRYFTGFVTDSAFEGGSIAQMYGAQGACTVSLLDLANSEGNKIFNADSSNYNTIVRPQLVGYSSESLAGLDDEIANGYRVIVPEHGNLQMGSFVGAAHYSFSPDGYYSSLIMGELNGGYGTQPGVLDPDVIAAEQKDFENADDHPQSKEPIDLFTGYFLNKTLDLIVGGRRMPFGLSLIRSYNSGACKKNGPFGLGWTHSLDIKASVGSDGFRGMGSMSPLDAAPVICGIFVASDIFVDTMPVDRVLLSTIINQWLMENLINNVVNISRGSTSCQFVKMPDGTYRPQPNKWAQLEKKTDGSFLMTTKYGIKFDFDTEGKLSTRQDPNGNTVTFNYTGGKLSSVDNGLGKGLYFNYDDKDRIWKVTDHTGRQVTYTYDDDGNLATFTDPEDNEIRYEYDVPGRLTKIYLPEDQVNPYVINKYINADDIAKFRYQPMQVIKQTDPRGNEFSYYFVAGRYTEEVDPYGNSRTYEFNQNGYLTRHINPLGLVTTADYDGFGRLLKMTLPEGNGREFTYDSRDNVLQVSFFPKTGSAETPRTYQFTYEPVFNKVLTITDPLGQISTFSYDSKGNMIGIELPETNGVHATYTISVNSRGQIETIENPLGIVTRVTYDNSSAFPTSYIVDANDSQRTISTQYDDVGNLIQVTDPRGNSIKYEYDKNRQLISEQDPAPLLSETTYSYDSNRRLSSYARKTGIPSDPWLVTQLNYDLPNAQMSIIDPQGRTITFLDNKIRRLWKVIDNAGHTTEVLHDERGKAYRLINPLGDIAEEHHFSANGKRVSIKDANTNITRYQYDDFDRLSKMIFPDNSFVGYTYDARNRLIGLQTRSGEQISYQYNSLDHLVLKTLPDSSTISFESDLLGRLTRVTSSNSGTISFEYDNLNHIISVTHPGSKTFSYEYDSAGNLAKIVYPDGYYVTYTFDELNRVTEIFESDTNLLARYTYDALSRLTDVTYGNGASERYTYNASGDLLTIEYHFNNEDDNFTYAYDSVGNLMSFTTNNPAFLYSPPAESRTDFTVNNLNQYVSVNGTAFSYNQNGNLISDGVNTYAYDATNQLISATNSDYNVTFQYNALKQRIKKEVNGVATTYLYSGFNLFAEYDHQGNLVKRYIYGPGVDFPVMLQTSSGNYYYHLDRIHSVVALSDASGNIVESYSYSPFGQPNHLSTVGNSLMFAGREYDKETGLYYYRARYYSPTLGRFISPDPIGYDSGDMNLYAYVFNDPVNYTDALGLSWYFPGDGYVDEVQNKIEKLKGSEDLVERAKGEELQLIVDQLTEYGKFRDSDPGPGNCVVTAKEFWESSYSNPLKENGGLKYYDVKEIAASFIDPPDPGPGPPSRSKFTGYYEHFALAVGPKGSDDFNDQIFIYDPVSQPYHSGLIGKGQKDGPDRKFVVKRAIRNPKEWLKMLPKNYTNAKYYLGRDPNYLNYVVELSWIVHRPQLY